jgi:hypothetical protein
MPSSDIARGNILYDTLLGVTLSPAQVAVNTTAEQTFTVRGLRTTDIVTVQKPTAQAGLGIVGARVSAPDTLAITFSNNTSGAITPTASQLYYVRVTRPSNPGQPLPTAMV